MVLLKLLLGWNGRRTESNMEVPERILGRAEFSRLMRNERLRTDRTGESFSMLSFSPRKSAAFEPQLSALLNGLDQRLRETDEIGLMKDDEIGVFLPETPAPGAHLVARDVLNLLPGSVPQPACEVYTYPNEEIEQELALPDADTPETAYPETEPTVVPGNIARFFALPVPTWKRAMDIAGASIGLLLLSPLLLAIAAAVKLTSPGPVFFGQLRRGHGGRAFKIYKFRSMVANAEALKTALLDLDEQDGPAFKIKNDPRITSVGRFLRKTSLDEIPQLWNVLKGDMSLVGPRPLPCNEADSCEPWQQRRLDGVPGLTCFWQVRGRSNIPFDEWMRMDLRYLQQQKFFLDVTLIAKTAWMVVKGKASC